ncbi:Restricted tev movement [Thalictrum thalictroides]|uniref:Restricted tev movement n=1 Tax=Thalictrum thalictroides TaxID=46969 RepID=A0A7J6V1H1_THATH|nr:Restricted tev movement [Thalictrum thalictroides]
MIKVGPSGSCTTTASNKNKPWDDIEKAEGGQCSRIYISYDSGGIRSIQCAYMVGTTVVVSEKHGYVGKTANHFHSIILDYPSEYITSITGYYGYTYVSNYNCIKSITFGTNGRTYGPYGSAEKDYSFSMTFGFGEFLGFHGYADDSYITAVGAYLKPYVGPSTSTAALIKSEPVG